MVAYNFTGFWTGKETREEQKAEVFRKIKSGIKYRTLREKLRCKAGDELQLYWGMRCKDCEKIMDAICINIYPVRVDCKNKKIYMPSRLGKWKEVDSIKDFVKGDGFYSKKLFFQRFKSQIYFCVEWRPKTG